MFQGAQWHLLMNHLPVFGALGGTLLLCWGLLRKQQEVMQVGLGVLCIAALLALPAYFSGENAEKAVEHLVGVSESLIENHEELARVATILMELVGLSALLSLWKGLQKWRNGMVVGTLVLALLTSGTLIWTAHLGGLIRHSELRAGVQTLEQTGHLAHEEDD
ncbi:MAG: hypothetical protein ACO1RX_22265 [Candidatus Sericytochromatia bacterium]